MQNVCQPLYTEGRNITGRAKTAVTGKRCLRITGNGAEGVPEVGHATAGQRISAVAGYSAAIGELVPLIRKGVLPIEASGAIAAGAEVEVGANGTVVTKAAGVAIGECLFDVANGADAFIAIYE